MSAGLELLTPTQREVVGRILPEAEVVRDHSWGLVAITVLELLASDGARYVVKAGGEADRHIARELRAHHEWVGVLVGRGRAPRLVHGDPDAKLVVTEHLPGELVEGTPHEWEPETHRQAGELLSAFHGQDEMLDDGGFERRQRDETLAWLDRPHRIDPSTTEFLRDEVERWPAPASLLVPTHGDWQPRNWLVHSGEVSVIDFGRADLRPRHTDLGRLTAQQWRGRTDLEAAFWEGYGEDPRTPDALDSTAGPRGRGHRGVRRQDRRHRLRGAGAAHGRRRGAGSARRRRTPLTDMPGGHDEDHLDQRVRRRPARRAGVLHRRPRLRSEARRPPR